MSRLGLQGSFLWEVGAGACSSQALLGCSCSHGSPVLRRAGKASSWPQRLADLHFPFKAFYLGCLPLPLRISFSLCPKKLEGRSWLPSPGPAASPATDHCAAFAAWWLVRLPFGVTQGSARASFCCWYPNFPSDCRRTDLRVGLATVRSASSLLLPLECEFVGRGYCWPFETLREAWPLLATEGGLDAIALA